MWSHRGGWSNTAKDRGGIKREKGVSEGKRRFYWRTNFRRSISARHHSFREFIFLSTLSKGIKSTNKRLSLLPLLFFLYLSYYDRWKSDVLYHGGFSSLLLVCTSMKMLEEMKGARMKRSSLCWFGIIVCDYLRILLERSVFNELIFFFFFFGIGVLNVEIKEKKLIYERYL